ncbi:MAG: type II toxin-antitoxin system Phd/YefM family antitoxin [Alphaproteobacteria bacterium]|uniref:Antitoxin n=1 Tax=Candidatus Nitrobium versatile TaxID=2884831 RepID=A0A953JFQ7_9BACT|nr:type II toxin-antitoxin system Phd/YefM family antitoxin [Candidatus Nitrobium versatile]
MSKTLGVAEIKKQFSTVISEVSLKGEHFIIEKKGKPTAALVSIKELEVIEQAGKKEGKKGLLAAIGAWEDFDDLEEVVTHIYEKRGEAQDRSIEGLV